MSPIQSEIAVRAALAYYPDRWAESVSDGDFTPYAYQGLMMRAVAEAVYRGGGRIIINVPSRHGKSTALSKWMSLWFLEHFPDKNIILGSYGQQLASDWGRAVRNEFQVNVNLTTRLAEDSQAVNAWHTMQGGAMFSAGVDGPILGRGFHLGIIDDPHKDWESAHSVVEREKTIRWFGSTFFSRQEPGNVIVIIQQRMHDEDLSGWLQSQQPGVWQVFRFPALAEANDLLGRKEGEPLCPGRQSRQMLEQIKAGGIGEAWWQAMFQQNTTGYAPGRLYHKYHQPTHVDASISLRDELPLQVDFDFNRNPGMHVEVGQYDPQRDLFTVRHEVHGPYMKLDPALKAITKLLQDVYGKWRWPRVQIFGDATGKQDRAETTFTAYQQVEAWARDLRTAFGVEINYEMCVPNANPPVRTRIDTFNAALRDGSGDVHFACHPHCVRLIADLRDMREDEQGLEDKRDSKLSHASSAVGYRICWLRPIEQSCAGNYKPLKLGNRYQSPVTAMLNGGSASPLSYVPLNTGGRYRTAF